MPQFDKITFFNQIFWLLFFFSGFYLLLLHYFLPKLSSIIKVRQKMLKNFLSGVSIMLNERQDILASVQTDCSSLLAQKNLGVFLNTTFNFIEWVKLNLFLIFNISLKKGLINTETRLYRQTSIFLFINDLKI